MLPCVCLHGRGSTAKIFAEQDYEIAGDVTPDTGFPADMLEDEMKERSNKAQVASLLLATAKLQAELEDCELLGTVDTTAAHSRKCVQILAVLLPQHCHRYCCRLFCCTLIRCLAFCGWPHIRTFLFASVLTMLAAANSDEG